MVYKPGIYETSTFNLRFDHEDQHQSIPQTIGISTKMLCTPGPNLVILAGMGVIVRTSSTWRTFGIFSQIWPWMSRLIAPQNNKNLNLGVLKLWSKFGDPSLKEWWVMAWTSSGWHTHICMHTQTHTQTHKQSQATSIRKCQNWPRVIPSASCMDK